MARPRAALARAMALAYPLLCALVLLTGGKPYYALPLLLVLLAAGCEPVTRWTARTARTALAAVAVAVSAAMSAVVTLPVLPPGALSVVNAVNQEQGEQIGWPALVDAAATGWSRVPADRRARAVILTENYGEAGALARYGPRAVGCPPVLRPYELRRLGPAARLRRRGRAVHGNGPTLAGTVARAAPLLLTRGRHATPHVRVRACGPRRGRPGRRSRWSRPAGGW
ncbi:hypothetical protein [Streptomyces sp. NPDC021212]|uniref:hypothetical protein n=1 Tax=Streptomyces sp. NPDC021212 TaxID=3365118 RepID=UPI00378F2119